MGYKIEMRTVKAGDEQQYTFVCPALDISVSDTIFLDAAQKMDEAIKKAVGEYLDEHSKLPEDKHDDTYIFTKEIGFKSETQYVKDHMDPKFIATRARWAFRAMTEQKTNIMIGATAYLDPNKDYDQIKKMLIETMEYATKVGMHQMDLITYAALVNTNVKLFI